MALLNHALLPCVFPGNPVPFPLPFGFTTTPGTTLIAVVCGPLVVDWTGSVQNTFKTDAGDIFQIVDGSTSQATGGSGASHCGSNPGVNIFWVQSGVGGATRINSILADHDFDIWIYEVSGITGVAAHGYAEDANLAALNGVSPSIDGGSSAFYVAGCVCGAVGSTVNAPWTLDQTDAPPFAMCFGDEFDYLAAYQTGSGVQTATFTRPSLLGWAVAIAAFSTAPAPGTIVVQKATNPVGAPQAFTFRPNWKAPFILVDGQSNSTSLAPGTYTVTEDSVLSWSTVVSGGDPNNIVLASGQTITLTFTNTFASSLPVCYADGIIPAGPINGVNTVFTLPSAPTPPGSLIIESDTSVLAPGVGFTFGFTLSGAQLNLTYPPQNSLVAWYRIKCGSSIPPLYKLISEQPFDDNAFTSAPTAINSTYFTYGFVNAAKSAQNPLLGFHRKRFTEIQLNVNGSGQFTVETFPNYILKQDLSYNPYAYVIPPILLQTDPPDDIIRPLNSVGNRVYLMFQTNAVGSRFDISKTIMVGTIDGWATVNPNAG